ncbi:MAG: toll/interleukin-1 receptor domain-containing protein [Gemmatimonadaceae bacterium]
MSAAEVYDLFLCHTGANKDWVRDLAERLEAEQIDGRPLRVFFDEWDIALGENILTRIEDGLRQSRYVAVVLSPALIRAAWPTMEWQTQVYDDPHGKRARIIPLLLQKFDPATTEPIDIPYPLRLLRFVDFSEVKRFNRAFEELLRRLRGQRPARGRRPIAEAVSAICVVTGPEAPDPVEEVLFANLFPLKELPPRIYSDVTTARRHADVWKVRTGSLQVPFVLHKERLYSFVPPDAADNPFRTLLTGENPKPQTIDEWLDEDEQHIRHLVWMCNDALRERCYALRIRSPKGNRCQFYPPSFDKKPRTFQWRAGHTIELAKVSESGVRPLGIHKSARMRFLELGRKLHLLIEPGYFFTTDGVEPLEGRQVGILSVKWGGREGNDTVLRQTLMWARLLAAGNASIVLPVGGGASITVAPVPVHGRSNLGILGDSVDVQRLLVGEDAGEVAAEGDTTGELDLVAAAHERGEIEAEAGARETAQNLALSDPDDLDQEREELMVCDPLEAPEMELPS